MGFLQILALIAAYLVGSIPFAFLVARAKGVDIRKVGSGNVGATNVGRTLGRPYGILVFLLDYLKGAVPTALTIWWRGGPDVIAVAVGLLTIIGHVFSVFLRFEGGKGVATAAGALIVLLPLPTGLAILAFAATIIGGRFMSIASITGAVTLAVAQLSRAPQLTAPTTLFALIVAGLIVFRHRTNIVRLMDGCEPPLEGISRLPAIDRAIHLVALGMWCGAGWFFSMVVAPQLFETFNAVVKSPEDWLPLSDDTVKDLGSRLAGVAVSPIFPRFFSWQAICGVIATGIAIGWAVKFRGRLSKIHAALLIGGVLLVAISWPINRTVAELRTARYSVDPAISTLAHSAFARWHLVSLALNLGTLVLITPALALAGYTDQESKTDIS